MGTKEEILDDQHWRFKDYTQRITYKQWKTLLLNDDDNIIFEGRVMKLKVKNVGFGMVEITK